MQARKAAVSLSFKVAQNYKACILPELYSYVLMSGGHTCEVDTF